MHCGTFKIIAHCNNLTTKQFLALEVGVLSDYKLQELMKRF